MSRGNDETTQTNLNSKSSSNSTGNVHPPLLRGLFAGSGYDGIATQEMVDAILGLLPEPTRQRLENNPSDVTVVYMGTAMYDLPVSRDKHIGVFVERGLRVECLDVALDPDRGEDDDAHSAVAGTEERQHDCKHEHERWSDLLETADVLVASCGNTLFAVDRWKHLELVPLLQKAAKRGCVLAGGSAGAICWFDSGHSDSADPDTFLGPLLEANARCNKSSSSSSSSSSNNTGKLSEFDACQRREWSYLRVPGLSILPGRLICCPHHDKVQSNGVLRADDFDAMLRKRAAWLRKLPGITQNANNDANENQNADQIVPHVVGIGIDHYAAWIVEGDRYQVFALPGRPGSVGSNTEKFAVDSSGNATGTPGVWIKRVRQVRDNGNGELVVTSTVCPVEGSVSDLLGGDNEVWPKIAFEEDDDEENRVELERCRRDNSISRMPQQAH